jgi:hypothetical protein
LTAAVERGPSEGARPGSKESFLRPCATPSETALSDLPLIVLVAANPEPRDCVTVHNPRRSIAERDADRPHAFTLVDALKMEGGMNGGFFPEKERLARGLTNMIGKAIVRFPKAGQRVGN